MRIWRWFVLGLLTMILCAWMVMILSQRNAPMMIAAYFGSVWLVLLSARRRHALKGWKLLALGALVGYIGMVFAAAVGEIEMRGVDFFRRSFVSNLYYFPTLSFGWLYGALAFWLVSDRSAQPMGASQTNDCD